MYKLLAIYFIYKLIASCVRLNKNIRNNIVPVKSIIMIIFSTVAIVWGINGGF